MSRLVRRFLSLTAVAGCAAVMVAFHMLPAVLEQVQPGREAERVHFEWHFPGQQVEAMT